MLEQELVELTEYYSGGGGRNSRNGRGWSLVTTVWDERGERPLGCLRMESSGDGDILVAELEESNSAM